MKKLLVFLCAISFVLGISGTVSAITLTTASGNGGPYNHDYGLFTFQSGDLKTWAEAKAYIETEYPVGPFYLATITSQAEQDFIASSFGNFPGEYWIGAYQIPGSSEPAGGWKWVTGETWNYTSWYSGEPNDLGGENYGAVWSNFGWNWNDEGNLGNIVGFIVEYGTPVPEPSTMLLLGAGLLGLAAFRRRLNQ